MIIFLYALHYSILSLVPKTTIRPSTFQSWFTHELKELICSKACAHVKFKSTHLLFDYQYFSPLSFLSTQYYQNFVACTESSLLHNPCTFQNFVSENWFFLKITNNVSLNGLSSSFSLRLPTNSQNIFLQSSPNHKYFF